VTETVPDAAARELVALANRHGGRDNITLVVLDVVAGGTDVEATLPA
jgi:serine/threonine protein phosphatase PrpC